MESGYGLIRYFSETNPWIDFVVTVQVDDVDVATKAVIEAMDEFWNISDLCYGDLVESYLAHLDIDYDIVYRDGYCDDDEDETVWEAYLDELYTDAQVRRELM